YGNLETLLARTSEIKQPKRRESLEQNAALIRISKQLVTLRDDVPTPAEPEAFDKRKPDPNVLLPWLEQQGFRTLLQRFTGELGEATAPVAPAASAPIVTKVDSAPAKPAPAARAKSNQPFTAADYELIQDEKQLAEWVAEATKAGTVAFDCETDGLDSNNAGLVGVSLALLEGPWGDVNSTRRRAAYLPLMHRVPDGAAQGALDLLGDGGDKDGGKLLEGQIALKKAIAALKPLLEDPAVLKVGQNIKYDMAVFQRYGIEIGPVDDTMLISFVLDAGKNNHGMDELAERHLGQKTIKFSDVAGSGAKQVSFDHVPLDKARDYAAEDADVTMQLWAHLKPRLVPEHMTTMYETIERPLI
ncbi:MAG: DNA polymerase I, partial [Reyranella sp.]|nr:DNA polymerase I [Reyranella sp.]